MEIVETQTCFAFMDNALSWLLFLIALPDYSEAPGQARAKETRQNVKKTEDSDRWRKMRSSKRAFSLHSFKRTSLVEHIESFE